MSNPFSAFPPPPALGGITSLNSLLGDVNLLPGTNITLTPAGNDITIDADAPIVSGALGAVQLSNGSGDLTSDATKLFYDTVNHRLGIGTNAPDSVLTVLTSDDYGVMISDGSVNLKTYIDASGAFWGTTTNNDFGLYVNDGGPALIIKSPEEYVGIHQPIPTAMLEIGGRVGDDSLRLGGSTSGYVGFKVPAAAGSTSYTLPSSDGSAGQFLSTNASGVLSWASAGGGGAPADFIFSNSSSQSWNGAGPALLVDSVAAAGGYGYIGSSDVPLLNTTDDSVYMTLQTGFILEPTSLHQSQTLDVLTGFNYGLGGTGQLNVFSGDISNALNPSNTGGLNLVTGNTNGAGNSGSIQIKTGSSSGGARGSITLDALFAQLPVGTADPSGVSDGCIYYNTSTDKLRLRANGAWVDLN